MPDPSPADFTQTVVGGSTNTGRAQLSQPSTRASIEARYRIIGQLSAISDPTVWFMPQTTATLLLVPAIAIFAFWPSLGTHSFLGDNPQ